MKRLLIAALAGMLFGAGLVVSELSNPDKVLAFLDVAGSWDPSLLIVMAVAAGGTALGYRLVWRRPRTLCDGQFELPKQKDLDARLMIGAVLFGVGWGLTGYCPGPALTSLVINPADGAWFVVAMALGSFVHSLTSGRLPGNGA